MTLEELIRAGLDVEQIPPGTAVILHARRPLDPQMIGQLREDVLRISRDIGIKIAVVTYDFDLYLVPEAFPLLTVNGAPEEEEIRR